MQRLARVTVQQASVTPAVRELLRSPRFCYDPGHPPIEIVRFYSNEAWIGGDAESTLMSAYLKLAEQTKVI